MFMFYSPFKSSFKIVYTLVLACSHFNSYYMKTEYVSPWYNHNGRLGVKHQVTYLLSPRPLPPTACEMKKKKKKKKKKNKYYSF